MTKLRVEDLPPKLRAQVLASDAGGTPALPAEERGERTGGAARSPGPRYCCHTCGELFERYGQTIEKHADTHHGARLEAIL